MSRFAFRPERREIIQQILSNRPDIQDERNQVYQAQGIDDPEILNSPVEVQVAIDGATLRSDTPEHQIEGTELGIRVLYDAQRLRPHSRWEFPAASQSEETIHWIDVIEVNGSHLQITVDERLVWELVGPNPSSERIKAPHLFHIGLNQEALSVSDPRPPTTLALLTAGQFDLSILSDWNALVSLELFGSGPTSIQRKECIETLTALQHLIIRNPPEGLTLDDLSVLTHLETLEVAGMTGFENLNALRAMKNLRVLSVAKTSGLINLNGLEKLDKLIKLDANGCKRLTNVDGLKHKPVLEVLNLQSCKQIEDLSALQGMRALRELNLMSTTALESLDLLVESTQMERLNIRHCKTLKDIRAIQQMPNLSVLMLEGCSAVHDFSPLAHLEQLTKASFRRCKAFSDLNLLIGNTLLEDLNVSDCPYLTDWRTLERLTGLQTLKGVPPALTVRTLAQHAARREQVHLICHRFPLFETASNTDEPWIRVAEREPEAPGLLGALAMAIETALNWDDAERLADIPDQQLTRLLTLASLHPAEGVKPVLEVACRLAGQRPIVAVAIEQLLQQPTPLPAPTLSALIESFHLAPAHWAQPLAAQLRNHVLTTLSHQAGTADPYNYSTAQVLQEQMDGRTDILIPNGYPLSTTVHEAVLKALEASNIQEMEVLLLTSLASDHAQSGIPSWTKAFHLRLRHLALSISDPTLASQALGGIAAGLANADDADWSRQALDDLLSLAATINPDTSELRFSIAIAQGRSGQWETAESTALSIGVPQTRDRCLDALANDVLKLGNDHPAQRAVALILGISTPRIRLAKLQNLSGHPLLIDDPVAYGLLVAALIDYPELQATVVKTVIEQNPKLGTASKPSTVDEVRPNEHRHIQQAIEARDHLWFETLTLEDPDLAARMIRVMQQRHDPN